MSQQDALKAARRAVSIVRYGRRGDPMPYKILYPWRADDPRGPSTESARSYSYDHARSVAAGHVAYVAAALLGGCLICAADPLESMTGSAAQRLRAIMSCTGRCGDI